MTLAGFPFYTAQEAARTSAQSQGLAHLDR